MTIIPELERQLFTIADKVLPIPPDSEAQLAAGRGKGSGSGASRFRCGTRLAVSGLAAVAVAAVTVAAAAAAVNLLSAATGIQVRVSDPNARAIGTGQAIALGAPDDVSFGVKLTQDIPFAPGYESWRAGTIAFQTTLVGGAHPGHAYMTSSALRWQVAESAVCSWLNYYVASQVAGNTATATSAAAQVRAAPRWPAITGLSYPSGLGPVVAAVGADDAKLVQALMTPVKLATARQ